jgi:hypothetical protein
MACEAITIPGEVWTAFLKQEYQLVVCLVIG